MSELVLERVLEAGAERVFDFLTQRPTLLTWFGPEGSTLPEENLDFSRPGPWFSVMINAEGQRYKVSGHVTRVEKPNLVAFTWGWHDPEDRRGRESHVMIELTQEAPDRTRLVLRHTDLPEDAVDAHRRGWTSTLVKIERAFA